MALSTAAYLNEEKPSAMYTICNSNSVASIDMDKVGKLLTAGIDLRYQHVGEQNRTALRNAACSGYIDVVKALVAADPDPAHLNMKVRVP
jgi:hypothetical protein